MKVGPGDLTYHAAQSLRHFLKRVGGLLRLALRSDGQPP